MIERLDIPEVFRDIDQKSKPDRNLRLMYCLPRLSDRTIWQRLAWKLWHGPLFRFYVKQCVEDGTLDEIYKKWKKPPVSESPQ